MCTPPSTTWAGAPGPTSSNRVVACLILAQIILLVVLLRYVIVSTILLIPLPVFTYIYNSTFISAAFEPTFSYYALEVLSLLPASRSLAKVPPLRAPGIRVLHVCLLCTVQYSTVLSAPLCPSLPLSAPLCPSLPLSAPIAREFNVLLCTIQYSIVHACTCLLRAVSFALAMSPCTVFAGGDEEGEDRQGDAPQ